MTLTGGFHVRHYARLVFHPVISAIGLSPEQIALAYQTGYLILPGVVPVVVWVLLNQRFIEGLMPLRTVAPAQDEANESSRPGN